MPVLVRAGTIVPTQHYAPYTPPGPNPDLVLRQAGFDGDLETRVSALERGTLVHATTEEVSD
jgi:hypothetical protein